MAENRNAGGRAMSAGQRAYEEKRALKAGRTLDAHLTAKAKREAEAAAAKAPPKPEAPAKKPGLLKRLIERAHKPL